MQSNACNKQRGLDRLIALRKCRTLDAEVLRKIGVDRKSSRISSISFTTTTKLQTIAHQSNHQDAHISKHHHLPHLAVRHPDHSRICAASDTHGSILQCTNARQCRPFVGVCVHPDIPVFAILALLQHLAASPAKAALLFQALPQRQLGRELGLW